MHRKVDEKIDGRHLAYLCLIAWQSSGTFIWDTIEYYKKKYKPLQREIDFAYEIACGTVRLFGYIEYIAKNHISKLPKKPKERLLFFLGLYQRLFMPSIPLYAVVATSVTLAKTYCSKPFGAFLNAVLRKQLPIVTACDVALHSYPDFFKSSIEKQCGHEKMMEILLQQNKPPIAMATTFESSIENMPYESLPEHCYIQNKTPFALVMHHSKLLKEEPETILDMCAAPGGKSVLLAHIFPKAHILANDLPHKATLLQENIARFCPHVMLHLGPGQDIAPSQLFDLIVVDAPCSNSGVLYKCPEARWRLSPGSIQELEFLQLALLEHAAKLLKPNGTIWYMTCSILDEENRKLAEKAAHAFTLKIGSELAEFPNKTGADGGYVCSLHK